MEGDCVVIDYDDMTPSSGVFDFIDRMINYANMRVVIYLNNIAGKDLVEKWLIAQHHPMLTYITIGAVVVTDKIPQFLALISSRAIRFTNWRDAEKYFIGNRI
jgi:hypothetical protein